MLGTGGGTDPSAPGPRVRERRKTFLSLWGLWSRALKRTTGIAGTRALQILETDLSELEDHLQEIADSPSWEERARTLQKRIEEQGEQHGSK